jgi:hypothetical protein
MLRRKRSTLRNGFATAACVGVLLPGTFGGILRADDRLPDRRTQFYTDPLVGADDLQAQTSGELWGEYQVDGQFTAVVPIPGEPSVLAIDVTGNRLARYDTQTNELTHGGIMPAEFSNGIGASFDILVSPEKTWVYVVPPYTPVGRSAARFSMDTLQFDKLIDLTPLLLSDEPFGQAQATVAAIVPGDERRIVVRVDQKIGVFDDGVLVSVSGAPTFLPPADIIVFGDRYGFELDRDGGLSSFEIGPTGNVTRAVRTADGFNSRLPLRAVGAELVRNDELLSVPGLVPRITQPFEVYDRDPILPLLYKTEVSAGPPTTTIFDAETTEEITSGLNCTDLGAVLIGNGLAVTTRLPPSLPGPLYVTSVLDRCGGYGEFHPVQPDRIVDTRDGSGGNAISGRLSAGSVTRVKVHGFGGVPATGVESVVLNVTAVNQQNDPDGWNFLTVWPAGFEQPAVSNLNVPNGRTVGNQVTVATAEGGFVDIYSDGGDVDLTVDVAGYFGAALSPRGARFVSAQSQRAIDTREGGQRLGPTDSISIATEPYVNKLDLGLLRGAKVVAVAVNVTAIRPSEQGFITLYPAGAPLPTASSMNFDPRGDIARSVTVPTGPGGVVTLRNEIGTVDVAVDILGVYISAGESPEILGQPGRFVGIVPERSVDTREASPFDGDGRLDPRSFVVFGGYRSGIRLLANLTAVRTDGLGFLWAGPWVNLGANIRTSSLNYWAGSNISNEAMIEASREGEIAVYSWTDAHVLIDIFGFYT